MNISPQAIIIIAAVFGVSFLAMIPIMLLNKNKNKSIDNFKRENSDKAILYLYATNPIVDGIKASQLTFIKGEAGSGIGIVALDPGTHTIEAKYETTDMTMLGKSRNYKTPKPIASQVTLEAGYEYNIGIYFYSPEERYNYYKGDVGENVGTVELSINGSATSKAYVICYKEAPIGA